MLKAFNQGADIHVSTAAKLFKIPIEEVSKNTKEVRQKTVNFGIEIWSGAFCFSAEQTGLSRSE